MTSSITRIASECAACCSARLARAARRAARREVVVSALEVPGLPLLPQLGGLRGRALAVAGDQARGVRVVVPVVPAGTEHAAQGVDRPRLAVRTCAEDAVAEAGHRGAQGLVEQLFLAAEVVVDGRRGDSGDAGDVLEIGRDVAFAREHHGGGIDDLDAPRGPVGGSLRRTDWHDNLGNGLGGLYHWNIMSHDALPKPANRPSRRQDLIAAAVELFSLQPSDLVTVADIVQRAGMTPAAFYYHFSSREQLLEEVVREFAEVWTSTVESLLGQAMTREEFCDVATKLLDEIEPMEQVAKIFFLSGATAPVLVEQIRRDARTRLIKSAASAIGRIDSRRATSAPALVSGLSTVILYETALRSRLTLDDSYRTLGPRRFREELSNLSRVASGFAA